MSRLTPYNQLHQHPSDSPELYAAGSDDEWAAATAASELTCALLGGLAETLQEEDVLPGPTLPGTKAT